MNHNYEQEIRYRSILLEVIRLIRVICEICGLKKQIRELYYEVEQEGLGNPDSELSAAVKSII